MFLKFSNMRNPIEYLIAIEAPHIFQKKFKQDFWKIRR